MLTYVMIQQHVAAEAIKHFVLTNDQRHNKAGREQRTEQSKTGKVPENPVRFPKIQQLNRKSEFLKLTSDPSNLF